MLSWLTEGFACFHNLNLCSPLPNFWQELETFSLLSNGAPAGLTDQVGRGLRLQMFPQLHTSLSSSSMPESSGFTHWGDPKQ